ncbi:P-loop containing nucleoside triphosphate hydrolase protein [Neoconidiobolus thromboides FSU 785]|nr:P-loop containing nucleoside triphosphate hydrolase protein [Neoconidiobolus thromboides FSU 785]
METKVLSEIALNQKFFRRFYRLLKLGSGGTRTFLINTTILLIIATLKEVAGYYSGLLTSKFYVVLNKQDLIGFNRLALKAMMIIFLTALLMSILLYFQGYIAWVLRKNMTQQVQIKYFRKDLFFKITSDKTIDNPDQRIAQDIDKLTTKFGKSLIVIILSPFLICYYTYRLYQYAGYYGPLTIYAYFVFSTFISKVLMSKVSKLIFMTEKYEGQFRSDHIHVLKQHQEISLLNGELREGIEITNTFNELLRYQKERINRGFFIYLNEQFFSYFGSIITYLVVAIPIFSGVYKNTDPAELSGIISLVAFISMALVYQFTLLIQQSTPISDIVGYTTRICQLLETLEVIENNCDDVVTNQNHNISEPISILLDNIRCVSPKGTLLFKDLSICIRQMEHVLITGSNGSGKSSFVKLLAGLWKPASGKIKWPLNITFDKLILFMPAKPHFVHGTLRDQIIYPDQNDDINLALNDNRVYELLNQVGLSDIVNKLNGLDSYYTSDQWYTLLTPGQQQKLVLLRLFYHKPIFAVLDESTAFIDHQSESKILNLLSNFGITLIFITQNHPELILTTNNVTNFNWPTFHTHLNFMEGNTYPKVTYL